MNYKSKASELFKSASSYFADTFIPGRHNNYQPAFLQSKALLYAVLFVAVLKILTLTFYIPYSNNIFFADITKIDLLHLLNQSREDAGLNPLTESLVLDNAAYLKAQDMIAHDYFAHQSPQGLTPWHWFTKAGYTYTYAGENLAVGFFDSPEVFNAWLNSPGHKANILNSHYKEVGTAVLSGFPPNNSILVVQLFGNPAKVITPAPAVIKPRPINPLPQVAGTQTAPVSPEAIDPKPAPLATTEDSNNQQVLAQSTENLSFVAPGKEFISAWYAPWLNYAVYRNEQILEYSMYAILLLVAAYAIIHMIARTQITHQPFMFRSFLLIVLLGICLFINKDFLPHAISHQIATGGGV